MKDTMTEFYEFMSSQQSFEHYESEDRSRIAWVAEKTCHRTTKVVDTVSLGVNVLGSSVLFALASHSAGPILAALVVGGVVTTSVAIANTVRLGNRAVIWARNDPNQEVTPEEATVWDVLLARVVPNTRPLNETTFLRFVVDENREADPVTRMYVDMGVRLLVETYGNEVLTDRVIVEDHSDVQYETGVTEVTSIAQLAESSALPRVMYGLGEVRRYKRTRVEKSNMGFFPSRVYEGRNSEFWHDTTNGILAMLKKAEEDRVIPRLSEYLNLDFGGGSFGENEDDFRDQYAEYANFSHRLMQLHDLGVRKRFSGRYKRCHNAVSRYKMFGLTQHQLAILNEMRPKYAMSNPLDKANWKSALMCASNLIKKIPNIRTCDVDALTFKMASLAFVPTESQLSAVKLTLSHEVRRRHGLVSAINQE